MSIFEEVSIVGMVETILTTLVSSLLENLPPEDVRKAMVAYQSGVKGKLMLGGKLEEEASSEAMDIARQLLTKITGSPRLAGLDEAKWLDVVSGATAKLAELQS